MTILDEQAPAKINLTLRVLGRRTDGYHELESLVAFADVADNLTLEPDETPTLDVSGPFAAASGKTGDNLVLKAFDALQQRVEGLKAGRFTLLKSLPVAAGIGGGSADAAAALRLLARLNDIAFDDARLAAAALATGADVPVCLESRARFMRGIGERLSPPLTLPPLPAVLVNPGVPLSTHDVFAKFTLAPAVAQARDDVPADSDGLIDYLARQGNDLTPAAIACVPTIANVLDTLRALPGVKLARMSGSGPSCFALFGSHGEAVAAAQRLKTAQRDWWIAPTNLAGMR
ncbi:MAG: 4-(cytidine 5'-diphospho)-2-C-methyl-D-erythritol kinase [Rhizobiales bacterium]|nr:4-(cytidine 5'-diphospho)-2-C-methyl-D-erythritol kinase [Hyphomicrobiales bacterium]